MQTGVSSEKVGKRPSTSGLLISAGLLLLLIVFWAFIFSTRLVPPLYLAAGCAVSAVLVAGVLWLTWGKSHRIRRVIGFILAGISAVVCIVGGLMIGRAVYTVRQVTDTALEHAIVAFYVESDSPAETLNDLEGETFGILADLDRDNTNETLRQVAEEYELTFPTEEYASLTALADALRNGEVSGIILNQAFLTLYEETPGYETFPEEIRELSAQKVEYVLETSSQPEESAEPSEPEEDLSVDDFDQQVITVLISGSDTRDNAIDQRGRSDVNIIARVNLVTHKVLLVSTPRDYFVPLALDGNPEDKLTHAGIYGMDVLMETLENLYNIKIDYYFRVNFTGFIDIIDALGGIEVYSAYTFDTQQAKGYSFQEGMNTMDGAAAKAFVQERYSFPDGDRQRGRNQLAVVEAVIRKALSPSILSGYLDILESVESCIDTSVPYDLVADLVRWQLSENPQWEIESYSVNGSDAHSTTYSMNQSLYVMIPDESTVQEAQDKLASVAEVIPE